MRFIASTFAHGGNRVVVGTRFIASTFARGGNRVVVETRFIASTFARGGNRHGQPDAMNRVPTPSRCAEVDAMMNIHQTTGNHSVGTRFIASTLVHRRGRRVDAMNRVPTITRFIPPTFTKRYIA